MKTPTESIGAIIKKVLIPEGITGVEDTYKHATEALLREGYQVEAFWVCYKIRKEGGETEYILSDGFNV